MIRFTRVGAKVGALAAAGALVAACGSSSTSAPASSSPLYGVYGKIPAASTATQVAGNITVAEPPKSSPLWIMPLINGAYNSVFGVTLFDYDMWRPLYWPVTGTAPTLNPSLSIASLPVVSNNDKTYTIKLDTKYKWSDGTPVTSKDVLFWYDMLVAAIKQSPANWAYYTPGVGLPDQVASVTAPNSSTVVFTMKSAINPTWLIENELSVIQPMPAQAWARDSANGPLLNYAVPANANKIYTYLSNASKSLGTWAANPLWKVVDGPYVLKSFSASTGGFTMVPNTKYDGPHAKVMSDYTGVPYTSDAAEFNAVKAGSIAVGYVPLTNFPQIGSITSGGYNVYGYPDFGWLYVVYNFKDTTGHFNNIISQLYMRQVMAHLQDQPGVVKAFFDGAAAPSFGPVPSLPKSKYTPSNALTNPYPYSIATAKSILTAHGWKVVPGGTDTCIKPGTAADECGAGIPSGTALSWNLIYTTSPTNIGEQMTALVSQAKQAGIEMHLQASNFNTMTSSYNNPASPKNVNQWAMEDFGGFTNSTYPTTFGVFNCTGSSNFGTYCSKQADTLINNSVYSTNPSAVSQEASYLADQQPGLFQPNPATALESGALLVWKKTLSGPPAAFSTVTQYYINPELMYFVK